MNKTIKAKIKTWNELLENSHNTVQRTGAKVFLLLEDGISLTQNMDLLLNQATNRIIEATLDENNRYIWNKKYVISPIMIKETI